MRCSTLLSTNIKKDERKNLKKYIVYLRDVRLFKYSQLMLLPASLPVYARHGTVVAIYSIFYSLFEFVVVFFLFIRFNLFFSSPEDPNIFLVNITRFIILVRARQYTHTLRSYYMGLSAACVSVVYSVYIVKYDTPFFVIYLYIYELLPFIVIFLILYLIRSHVFFFHFFEISYCVRFFYYILCVSVGVVWQRRHMKFLTKKKTEFIQKNICAILYRVYHSKV